MSKLGFFFTLWMTQLWIRTPPHSTCRLGDFTLAIWKLFRLRRPHARILKHVSKLMSGSSGGNQAVALVSEGEPYLYGGSLQNRFDSLRNHEDVGFPLRRQVGKVRLLGLKRRLTQRWDVRQQEVSRCYISSNRKKCWGKSVEEAASQTSKHAVNVWLLN